MQNRQYTITPNRVTNIEGSVAPLFLVFAVIIFIGGFICGIVFGIAYGYYDFRLDIAVFIWLISLFFGSLLLAMREILIVLHTQQAQTYTITVPVESLAAGQTSNRTSQQPSSDPKPCVQPKPLPGTRYIVCPDCGTEQPASRNICWECGARFSK